METDRSVAHSALTLSQTITSLSENQDFLNVYMPEVDGKGSYHAKSGTEVRCLSRDIYEVIGV